jgi:hypothetical protein
MKQSNSGKQSFLSLFPFLFPFYSSSSSSTCGFVDCGFPLSLRIPSLVAGEFATTTPVKRYDFALVDSVLTPREHS